MTIQTDRLEESHSLPTSDVTVGGFIQRGTPKGASLTGEVVGETDRMVTVVWDDGETEAFLRDLLDHPAYSRVLDLEAPTPDLPRLLEEVYPKAFGGVFDH
jgi:hypothetical protein